MAYLLRLYKAALNSLDCRFHARRNVELVEDSTDVLFDRFFADLQEVPDLLVSLAGDYQTQHF